MVTYNSSIALAVEQYIEFVKGMKAIVNGSHSSGAPTLPPTGMCRTSVLSAFVVGAVVAIGILHMCLVMARFSRLGAPSSIEMVQNLPPCAPVVSREERSNTLNGPTSAPHAISDNSLVFMEEGCVLGDSQDQWEQDCYYTAVSALYQQIPSAPRLTDPYVTQPSSPIQPS